MKTLKQRQKETGRTLALNGKAWRVLREAVLCRDPLCLVCGEPATDVDHLNNDPTDNRFNRDSAELDNNLIGLCHSCHSVKTQTGKLPTRYDENGLPTTGPWAKMVNHLVARKDQKSRGTDTNEPTGFPCFNANRSLNP